MSLSSSVFPAVSLVVLVVSCWMSLSKINSLWDDYLEQLEKNPVVTKALTAAFTSVVSDILAQYLLGAPLTNLNWTSIRNQFLIGLFIRGPCVHYWFLALEEIFARLGYSSKKAANSFPVVLAKVFLDQATFSPLFNLLYFYVIGMLEGRSLPYIHDKISREFLMVMMMNYKVWPLVNILNFKYVPANLRVLFGNIIGIFWTAYVIKLTK